MSNESEDQGILWATIGKIAVLVGILGTMVGIWNALTEPRSDVIATVSSHPFLLPPTLEKELTGSATSRSGAHDSALVQLDPMVASASRPSPHVYESIGDVHLISVVNKGTKIASGLSLSVPMFEIAVIDRAGDSTRVLRGPESKGSALEFDDLRPGEGIIVTLWESSFVVPPVPGTQEFRLVHKDGVGSVVVSTSVSPFWARLEKLRILILGWAAVGLLGLLWLLGRVGNRLLHIVRYLRAQTAKTPGNKTLASTAQPAHQEIVELIGRNIDTQRPPTER